MCDCSGGVAASKKKTTNTAGSPVNACKLPVLEGEVVAVTWKSGIKAAWAKATIHEPHWQKGLNVDDGGGSKRAAVYLLKNKAGSQNVEVQVNITKSQNVTGKSKLIGTLGNLRIEGECGTSAGKHTVSAKIKELPDKIYWAKGDILWGLDVPSMSRSIVLKNQTRAEVFVILDKPAGFYKKGVWVEALRFLCDKVKVTGDKDGAGVLKKISKYCHGSHGLRYDTTSGAPVYGCGGHGGSFKLDKYIKATLKVVNCYDQAGGVQSLSGALGVATSWCYQGTSPKIFGLIKTTDLIGVGNCNNPFYKSNGSAKIVPVTDPQRTGFGNHAFCEFAAKILDACAGPHVGSEDAVHYLNASVDYAETTHRGHTAGLAADIVRPAGVTKVE